MKFKSKKSKWLGKILKIAPAALSITLFGAAWAAPESTFNSGSSPGNSGDSGESSSTTASSHNAGPAHQWTEEEMLLARPMPMSKEGRDFSFSHKAPDTIRTWTLGEFHEYTRTLMGRNELKMEGQRWLGIKQMLKQQIALGKAFFANPKNFQPGRKKLKRQSALVNANSSSVSMSNAPEFDEGSFEPGESAATFERLKACREDITYLCHSLDEMKKLASRRGRLDEFERVLSSE